MKDQTNHKAIFIFGVSGSGKSTIGQLLSTSLKIPFFDGDDFHPDANIQKMSDGIPLTDSDRAPWLVRLNALAKENLAKGSCIIACSALKESYRVLLQQGINESVKWVHLNGSFEQISERLKLRKGHFMPPSLLQSQFDTLEYSEAAVVINIKSKPEEIVEIIKKEIVGKAEFGLYGLGVMGKSLSRNLASKGFKLALFNRHVDGVEENVARDFVNAFDELAKAIPFDHVEHFVNALEQPRKIMLMVNAGKTIDEVINSLLPYLSRGDIIIDGGNANYNQTNERESYLKSKEIFFIGAGVSGGEEGALRGPSIMPGGDQATYAKVSKFFNAIAAKDRNEHPCTTYIGPQGSGHFVKMIHNGIEYAEMQLLCEVYGILKSTGKNADEIAAILTDWKSTTNSYLLEITIDILRKKEGEFWLLDKIMDKAGNKGTGNWATIASAQLGMPSTMIATALFARYTSFYKDLRIDLDSKYRSDAAPQFNIDVNELLNAYQFARIINHYQGFQLINSASEKFEWNLNLSEIARIWTNGCIIRSELMIDLISILKESSNLLIHPKIVDQLQNYKSGMANIVAQSILNEIPVPCFSEAINFFNNITNATSTANLIQAQRDYFGAHTYQRIDDDSGKFHHTKWKE